jgi:beta-mannosidase
MLLLDLNGKWLMKRTDESSWLDAVVPGSVYNDLLQAGRIDDPFYRDNEYKTLELSNYDYEYKRSFTVDSAVLSHDKVLLLCEGLDTLCDIFINDKKLISTDNMHRTYEVDIKSFLFEGENSIYVLFKSPVQHVLRKQKEYPLQNVDDAVPGISHLRKAHCMFGWDWGPKLPDMGVWRNISIRGYDLGRLEDVYITQNHGENKVNLDVRVRLQKYDASPLELLLKVTTPQGQTLESRAAVQSYEEHIFINIDNPELWWPNTFGKQPLYKVEVLLLKDNTSIDSSSYRIGLRTVTVKREKDQWGESFEFEINGVSIFSMGADYIPEDNILARCSRERTEKLIKSCVQANFNSIRVWGGAYYPEDYFYDLCDEYGLLVWQDLMFACGNYRMTEEFKENIRQEAIDNIKRIRHHASLGLWCGNNELEVAWVEWGWTEKYSPQLKADYIKQFEVLLPEVAREIDPNTFYWLASPSSTGSFDRPNDENYGDMHYWGVWHGRAPFTDYRKYFPRYMSEFGIQSFPSLKTINTFTLPEDRNIFSYVMESHQKCRSGNATILYYIAETYKYPKNLDALVYASQLIQAEGLRYGVEHWRRNRGRCMGAIYWQLNDCWPVASWASVDYFGRWKALHYAAKRFFNPILLSACEDGTDVSLHVSNETMAPVSGKLVWNLRDTHSAIMDSGEKFVEVDALSSKECQVLHYSELLNTEAKMRGAYLEYKLLVAGRAVSSGTVLFVKSKHFEYVDPEITLITSEAGDKFVIEVSSNAFARFVELDLKDADAIFSDNYFDLSSGEVINIEVSKSNLSKEMSLEEFSDQLTARSLYDTFE